MPILGGLLALIVRGMVMAVRHAMAKKKELREGASRLELAGA